MSRTNKSVEAVLNELKPGIRQGRYVPGQRLITSELAEQLGTSLAPVREALHILAGEGLIELLPNRGARVRSLTPQVLIDGLQVLEVIGALALRLIAPKLKDAKLRAELGKAMDAIVDAGKRRTSDDFFAAISASHRLVNEHAGNSYLDAVINRVHLEYFYRQMADWLREDFWEQYIGNYLAIGGALAKGDNKTAERAWVRHTQWLIGLIRKRFA